MVKFKGDLKGRSSDIMVRVLDCGIVMRSNSSHAIMFTFRQIPFGKV